MKYSITLFLACFLMLTACTKEAEYNPTENNKYPVKKNAYRVVNISGTSTYWGAFNLALKYSRDELDEGYRTNATGDTVGSIKVNRSGSTYLKYEINDYIPNVDQDSINRINAELLAKYGAENYNLWDSLPKTSRSIKESIIYLYADGRIQRQIDQNFRPRKYLGVSNVNFNNSYILTSRINYSYEYNPNGDVYISRIMSDLMTDSTDSKKYKRTLYKNEAIYEGSRIVNMISYIANGGDNFTETNRYNYSYNGNQLTAITATGFARQFAWNGSKLTLTTNGQNAQYEFDGNGNVIKMDDGKGNVFNITYEAGNGNFNIFTLLFDTQTGIPYIK